MMDLKVSSKKPKEMNSLNLAYIGDAVYEMYVRRYVISLGGKPNALHRKAVQFVSAKAQSKIIHYLMDFLTDEEIDIVKRARNTKSNTSPKNTDIVEYRYSTAFEALVGYHFLTNNIERMEYFIEKSIAFIEREHGNGQKGTE